MNKELFNDNGLAQWVADRQFRKRVMPDSLKAMYLQKPFGDKVSYLAQWGKEDDQYWQNPHQETSNKLYAIPQGFGHEIMADPGDDPSQNLAPDISYSVQPDGTLHYNGFSENAQAQTLITSRNLEHPLNGGMPDATEEEDGYDDTEQADEEDGNGDTEQDDPNNNA
jgi:hypothetical protein